MKDLALEVSTDVDQKFDLALSLDDLDKALSITEESAASKKGSGVELKWRTLGDRALALWKVEMAAKCFKNAGDLPALLLVYSSLGDRKGMQDLADLASEHYQRLNTSDS
jgi:coatomer subunit beta'